MFYFSPYVEFKSSFYKLENLVIYVKIPWFNVMVGFTCFDQTQIEFVWLGKRS